MADGVKEGHEDHRGRGEDADRADGRRDHRAGRGRRAGPAHWPCRVGPWCGNIGRAILDTDYYKWFACGACGRAFRA